jgi:hydrogenase maturation factor
MCITRVGKILSITGSMARVEFLDDKAIRDIDVSMVEGIRKNAFVEVFADSALTILTAREAQWRKKLWLEMRKNMDLN